MQKQLKITYHYNSGFSVQIGSTLLVFDYWEGENRCLSENGRLTLQSLRAYEKIYFFVSHGHPDHFDNIIYTWRDDLPITYIVSSDMPVGTRGKRIGPGDQLSLERDITVRAFESTDLGVAFLVTAYGCNILHAGDLNLWHWRQESTLREIEAAEEAFYTACAPIGAYAIDLCFFPVDPRQGAMYDAGANHFILTNKPRVFVPMHWQDRPEVAVDFARRAKTPQTEIIALTRSGEVAELRMDERMLDIHIIEPPRDMASMPPMPLRRPDPLRPAYAGDPFEDTDLPVDLGGDSQP